MSLYESGFVRLLFCDGSGGRKCRVVPKESLSTTTRIGIIQIIMAVPIFEDLVIPDCKLDQTKEVKLTPDLDTLTKIPWDKNNYFSLVSLHNHDGTPWHICPRSILKRTINAFRKEFQLELDVGFEIEFQLFNQDDTPYDNFNYSSSTAFDQASPILGDILKALYEMGISITQMHKESAPAQYEFALQYGGVLEMCDKLLLAREAITAISFRHKLKASFMPKWSSAAAGNGNHVHISFRKTGTQENCFPELNGKYGVSMNGQHFMAGILENLPALACFTVPSPNSYKRLVPSGFSGAFVCWGQDNREAPVRLTSTGQGGAPTNFELKLMDASSNPYVGLSAVLVAGMDGLRRKLLLPNPVNIDPAILAEEERTRLGVLRLPTSTLAAVEVVQSGAGELFRSNLGNEMVEIWLGIRRREGEVFDNLSVEEQAKRLMYLY